MQKGILQPVGKCIKINKYPNIKKKLENQHFNVFIQFDLDFLNCINLSRENILQYAQDKKYQIFLKKCIRILFL